MRRGETGGSCVRADGRGALVAGGDGVGEEHNLQNNPCVGTNRSDTMRGTNARDTMSGRGGNDEMFGGGNSDTMRGGDGADIMRGESGRLG